MGALVVYESMFGSTRAVAQAVADGITSIMPVEVVEVASAPDPSTLAVDVLVVGAPTHAFGLSRPLTRRAAAHRASKPLLSPARGVREWLGAAGSAHVPVATFDTPVTRPNHGFASHAVERKLRRLGGAALTRPATFYVRGGYEGPLLPGELERAKVWGAEVAGKARDLARRG